MTSPPIARSITSTTRRKDFADIEGLKVAAQTILWNCGVDYGPNRINRLCVAFAKRVERNGFGFFDFVANSVALTAEQRRTGLANPDVARAIAYADPVGEAATSNVIRTRGF